jgi:hypothetical protein
MPHPRNHSLTNMVVTHTCLTHSRQEVPDTSSTRGPYSNLLDCFPSFSH